MSYNIVKQRFGKWVVLSYVDSINWKSRYLVKCDCGTERIIYGYKLTTGKSKQCKHCRFVKTKVIKDPKPAIIKDERYYITKWVKRNLLRKANKLFQTRRTLNVDDVVEKALQAKRKFPYLSFVAGANKAYYASLDRIDSNKDYSDINNIQIIPLWLNMAKLQLSEDELKKLMKEYLDVT